MSASTSSTAPWNRWRSPKPMVTSPSRESATWMSPIWASNWVRSGPSWERSTRVPSTRRMRTVKGTGSLTSVICSGAMRSGWPSWGETVTVPPSTATPPSPSSTTSPLAALSRKCMARLSRGRSRRRGAAFAAELDPAHELAAAVAAEALGRRWSGGEGGAAVLAELAAARLLMTRGAETGRLVGVVDPLGEILDLDLLLQLAPLGLGLHEGRLLTQLGSALDAETAVVVPADVPADPLAAAVALVEAVVDLLGGLRQLLVLGRAARPGHEHARVPSGARRLRRGLPPQPHGRPRHRRVGPATQGNAAAHHSHLLRDLYAQVLRRGIRQPPLRPGGRGETPPASSRRFPRKVRRTPAGRLRLHRDVPGGGRQRSQLQRRQGHADRQQGRHRGPPAARRRRAHCRSGQLRSAAAQYRRTVAGERLQPHAGLPQPTRAHRRGLPRRLVYYRRRSAARRRGLPADHGPPFALQQNRRRNGAASQGGRSHRQRPRRCPVRGDRHPRRPARRAPRRAVRASHAHAGRTEI